MTEPQLDLDRLSSKSPDAFFRIEFELGLTYVSPGFLKMSGYKAVEILRRHEFVDQWVHPSSLEDFQTALKLIREKKAGEVSPVLQVVTREGEVRWVEVFAIPCLGEDGEISGMEGYARDISEHHQVTDLLSRKMQEQAVLLQVQRELLTQLDLQYTLNLIVQKARSLLHANDCTLFLLDPDPMILTPVASSGDYEEEMMALRLGVGEGLTGWVVEHGTPQRVDHSLEDDRVVSVADTPEQDESLLCAPLQIGDQITGALLLGSQPEQYSDTDLEFLVAFTQVVSLAVSNSRLFAEVQRLATIDDLTGALNRNYFEASLRNELNKARRLGYPIGLLMVDVDDLKKVNDEHGHLAGDQLLKEVARLIKDGIRETDWVARYGGDEFAIVLPGCPSVQLEMVGKKLLEAISAHSLEVADQKKIHVGVSVGGAAYPENAASEKELVKEADAAEMEAKQAGGNQVKVRG